MKANLAALIAGNFERTKITGHKDLDYAMECHGIYYKRHLREAIFRLRQLELEDQELARDLKEERIFTNLVKTFADGSATRELTVPPNWLGVMSCTHCGEVPCAEELHGSRVQACPWCHTCLNDEDAPLPNNPQFNKEFAVWVIQYLVNSIKEWRK